VDSLTGLPTPASDGSLVDSTNTLASAKAEFESSAAYAEITAPLLSQVQDVPLVWRLELYASGRTERQKQTRSDAADETFSNTGRLYAYGLRYDPVEGVALRATR